MTPTRRSSVSSSSTAPSPTEPGVSVEQGTGPHQEVPGLRLHWIPLGAGERVVRRSGRIYERMSAAVGRRAPCDLYHSALVLTTTQGTCSVEMAPTPGPDGRSARGVVASGPVGLRWLGRFRLFRYEVRCWWGGEIPDLAFAVGEPALMTDDPLSWERVLEMLPEVPTPTWGRDELDLGEMWNSNSVISWVLTAAGLADVAGGPPPGGRAPGWDAGATAARRRGSV